MTRAGIYCRISEDRADGALGVGRQREDCLKIAAAKGWQVVDTYIDNNSSASRYSRKARTEYLRLLDDIEAGKLDAVVIWMEDRLQRQVLELAEFLKVCEKAGVHKIASVGGEFDVADPDQRNMLYIKAAMAEAEVEKLRSRVQRQRLQAAQRGEPHPGGRRGFGFVGAGRSAVAAAQVSRERELIRDAADRVLAGQSVHGIAAEWEQRDVRTPSGNHWSSQNIRQMLLSPAIAGYRTHLGAMIEGAWEPIIPPQRWEALRAVLTDPARTVGRRGRPAGHLLTGLAVCRRCGRRLATDYQQRAGGRRARIYACRRQVAYGGCGRLSRLAEPIEELVCEALFQAVEGPEFDRQMQAAASDTNDPTAELYRQLVADRARLDGLEDYLADGLLTADAHKRQRGRIEERMDAARSKLAATQSSRAVAQVPRNLREVWPSLSLDRRRAILGAIIERIEIHPQGTGHSFDPDAIKVTWRA
jgi:site-specific DNA recombinase